MSKEDILNAFDSVFADPGSEKSGEYLRERILKKAIYYIQQDRQSLVNILIEWIYLKMEPHTMISVYLAKKLTIVELAEHIVALKKDIIEKHIFPLYYINQIDKTLAHIKPSSQGTVECFKSGENNQNKSRNK